MMEENKRNIMERKISKESQKSEKKNEMKNTLYVKKLHVMRLPLLFMCWTRNFSLSEQFHKKFSSFSKFRHFRNKT